MLALTPDVNKDLLPMVLVVDDDPLQRGEIVRCLGDIGISTHEAADGKSAIDAVRKFRPAVVIMDIRMPSLDGVNAVKSLALQGQVMPKIILMTGDPDSLYAANNARLGVFAVIEKPVPLRSLCRFVVAAIASEKPRP